MLSHSYHTDMILVSQFIFAFFTRATYPVRPSPPHKQSRAKQSKTSQRTVRIPHPMPKRKRHVYSFPAVANCPPLAASLLAFEEAEPFPLEAVFPLAVDPVPLVVEPFPEALFPLALFVEPFVEPPLLVLLLAEPDPFAVLLLAEPLAPFVLLLVEPDPERNLLVSKHFLKLEGKELTCAVCSSTAIRSSIAVAVAAARARISATSAVCCIRAAGGICAPSIARTSHTRVR